jgi:hypothetical protein
LADAFLSFSATGTGSANVVYTVPTATLTTEPPVPPTTTLIKSIRLSNATGGAVATIVSVTDYSATIDVNLINNSIANSEEIELLTQPIVLEQQDTIKITGVGIKILISLMEIS